MSIDITKLTEAVQELERAKSDYAEKYNKTLAKLNKKLEEIFR